MISDYSPILPSVFGASCRYATDGTHYEGLLMPWRENTCGIRDRGPRILDLRAKKPPISNYPPTIPPQFSHYPVKIGASCRTRTFSLSVLLQSATAPPQEVASIRTEFLRQYRLLGRFSTVRSENFHRLSSALSEK